MIDLHCHILPGVDDGAKNLEESLEMARIAESEGIKKIINTSHYHPEFEYIMGDSLLSEVQKFNKILKENNIDIEVFIGNELYYSDNLLEYIENKDFYTLNNSRYLLIEFSPTSFPKNIGDIVYELKIRGYIPILAHVERYRAVHENINLIKNAIKEGALIQINASSLTSKGPKEFERVCNDLIKQNMVHFVATDAHSSTRRRPLIKDAYDVVCSKYGESLANNLFNLNAQKVLNNEEIIVKIKNISKKEKRSLISKLFGRKNKFM